MLCSAMSGCGALCFMPSIAMRWCKIFLRAKEWFRDLPLSRVRKSYKKALATSTIYKYDAGESEKAIGGGGLETRFGRGDR